MGFVRQLLRVFQFRSLNNPSVSLQDPEAWLDMFGGSASAAGTRVNRKTALKLSAVYRGVNLIATSVAKLPLNVWQREPREIASTHPAYRLLKYAPRPGLSSFVFRQTLMAHALLQGDAFAYIFRRGDGTPVELLPLLPDRTWPVRENGRLLYVTMVGDEPRKIDESDMLHIRGLGYDGLQGYSVIALGGDSLGLAIAGEKYAAKYFKNAASPGLLLEFPGKLGDKTFARLQQTWGTIKAGLENSHKPAILEEGGKATPFALKPADSQLIENRKFDLVGVSNWLGVPVHKLGGEGRTAYASLEQENQAFLDESLDGWLCSWESECWLKLLTEDEKNSESHGIEFLRQALVKANMTQRYAAYRIALGGAPFMLRNEVRARENLPPVDGWDEPIEPLNMQNPGGDPNPQDPATDGADPATNPAETDTNRKRREACRQIVTDGVRRMVRRLNVHAGRATDLKLFYQSFDRESEHGTILREVLGPLSALLPVERDLTDWLIQSYRAQLLQVPPLAAVDIEIHLVDQADHFFEEPTE